MQAITHREILQIDAAAGDIRDTVNVLRSHDRVIVVYAVI